MNYKAFIEIDPMTKKNPVPTRRKGHSIKHPKQRAYEEHLTMVLKSKREGAYFGGTVELFVVLNVRTPKTLNGTRLKKDERIELFGRPAAGVDPDLDNIQKPLLDSIVRAGFMRDDNQIALIHISKRFAPDDAPVGFDIELRGRE